MTTGNSERLDKLPAHKSIGSLPLFTEEAIPKLAMALAASWLPIGVEIVVGQQPEAISKPASLYSRESVWNQPIPTNPAIDENSPAMIEGLINSVESNGFVMNLNEWSIPVYQASVDTPRSDVTLAAEWTPHNVLQNVPIPSYARPDPLNDGHMVIISADSRCHFDLWQARKVGERWIASWGNALSLSGSGIYEQGLGARAAGFGLLAGLIWPEELEKGEINHALVFATGATRAGNPVPPATASDGVTAGSRAIPIGAHLQLDPKFDITTLPHPFLQTIARALQTYGMYCGDTTGGSVDLYALNPVSIPSNPYKGLLPDPESPFPSLRAIPASAFRVLKLPSPVHDPRSEVVSNSCNTFEGAWMSGVRDLKMEAGFAFLADGYLGLRVLDLSVPEQPHVVAAIETDEPATSIEVSGPFAFVGTAGAGVRAFDISAPNNPVERGEFGAADGLSIAATAAADSILYVLADDPPLLMSVDISEPNDPQLLSEIDDIHVLDTPRDLVINGSLLYVTDQVTQLQIIDISNPEKLTPLTGPQDEEFFPNSIAVSDSHAFVTDEDTGLLVFDLKVATKPKLVASLNLPDFAFGIEIQDQRAYIANGGAGLQVIDISQPKAPIHLQNQQPERGYARSVASHDSAVLLGSVGGGIITFQSGIDEPLHQVAAFENEGTVQTSKPPFNDAPPNEPAPANPPVDPTEPPFENPFRLVPLSFTMEGGFRFRIQGPEGVTVRLEISEDLEDWEILDLITMTTRDLEYIDVEAAHEAITFYRLTAESTD